MRIHLPHGGTRFHNSAVFFAEPEQRADTAVSKRCPAGTFLAILNGMPDFQQISTASQQSRREGHYCRVMPSSSMRYSI